MNIKITSILMLSFISSCTYAICNNAEKQKIHNCQDVVCVAATNNIHADDYVFKDRNYQLQIQGWSQTGGKKDGQPLIVNPDSTNSFYVCEDDMLTVSWATTKFVPSRDPSKKGEGAFNYCGIFNITANNPHINVMPANYDDPVGKGKGFYKKLNYNTTGVNLIGESVGNKYPAVCNPS